MKTRTTDDGITQILVYHSWGNYEIAKAGPAGLIGLIQQAMNGLVDVTIELQREEDYGDVNVSLDLYGWRAATPAELKKLEEENEAKVAQNIRNLQRMADMLEASGWHVDVPIEYRRKKREPNITS